MSDVVEIYICLEGQALKEGKVEVSHSIPDKNADQAQTRAQTDVVAKTFRAQGQTQIENQKEALSIIPDSAASRP